MSRFGQTTGAIAAALLLCVLPTAGPGGAAAAEKLHAVASFSILGDMVGEVGGRRVAVTTLVGPDSDVHDFEPRPKDAQILADADLLFINGLGLEGWLPRLAKAAQFGGRTVTLADGIAPEDAPAEAAHDHGHDAHEDEEAHGHDGAGHSHGSLDPHAWQSLDNAKIYVAEIRDALIAADPDGRDVYEANAAAYLAAIEALKRDAERALDKVPEDRRLVVTTHDAFGYLGREFGLTFVAPEGVSTESEASAKDVARIIDQIRRDHIKAVFLENISNPHLLQQIAEETGAHIGGTLYSDALSGPSGPAPTYLDMYRYNIETLVAALSADS